MLWWIWKGRYSLSANPKWDGMKSSGFSVGAESASGFKNDFCGRPEIYHKPTWPERRSIMPRDLLKDGVSAAQDNEDFIWEPQEATEEEVRQLMQQAMKEANEEYLATIVYDAGSGKRMPLRQFEKKYGTDEFSKELVHAAEIRAQYSRETAGKIKSLHAKLMRPDKPPTPRAKPESKPAIQTKPGKPSKTSSFRFHTVLSTR
jgi:hypothetical protein